MKKSRMETGMELLQKIDGRGGEAVLKSLEDIAPDLGKYIVEFACSGRQIPLPRKPSIPTTKSASSGL